MRVSRSGILVHKFCLAPAFPAHLSPNATIIFRHPGFAKSEERSPERLDSLEVLGGGHPRSQIPRWRPIELFHSRPIRQVPARTYPRAMQFTPAHLDEILAFNWPVAALLVA